MKYVLGFFSVLAVILVFALCPFNARETKEIEYLRIHIRADSNSVQDQNVKYKVKDAVVDALVPYLSEIKTFEEAKSFIENNYAMIEGVADEVLAREGFSYTASASLKNEHFPTRIYDNLTLKEGDYDALIINLGSGRGDNWWCVVFPAFCFTSSTKSGQNEYISAIWEIIKSVMREEK